MKYLIKIALLFLVLSCHNKGSYSNYFTKGEISQDSFIDSMKSLSCSALLRKLDEIPLRSTTSTDAFRLLVFSTIYNPYCINILKKDSLIAVTVKVDSDKPEYMRSGLTKFSLNYESQHEKIDSMFRDVSSNLKNFSFDENYINADFVAADGTEYLLESYIDEKYYVVLGWDGGNYQGKDDLMLIVRKIHKFIPKGLIPDLDSAKSLKDLEFSVIKKSQSYDQND